MRFLSGIQVRPRLIVEAKDEDDWEPSGKEFANLLVADIEKMQGGMFVPKTTPCKFTMLREEHYGAATEFFQTDQFDRVFIVHALD